MARLLVLTEGRSNPSEAKTACALLRYRPHEVVALLDSTQAGRTANDLFGIGGPVPVVTRPAEVEADTLVIGIAPAGGGLPEPWRPILREAIERGMGIVSGLHTFLADDPEIAGLARERGVTLQDVRRPPDDLTVSRNVARDTPCFRVHTVGHDCNVGKMSAALEIDAELRRRGHRSEFVATGQTGILITGWGLPIDRVISDFVSGATERLILEHQDAEYLLIEGQGSVIHPLYSGVTLGLLHGCAPQAMVLCYEAGRDRLRHVADFVIPPLEELIRIYEDLAGLICPSRVLGLCVNTSALSAADAQREIHSTEERLGLPVTDHYRLGVNNVVDAIVAAREREARTR